MSKTIYFTDDEDILVEFGQLMPLYPREGAELLWLRAGGQTRQAGYNWGSKLAGKLLKLGRVLAWISHRGTVSFTGGDFGLVLDRIRMAFKVVERYFFFPPPDNVERPEKPPPALPAKTAQLPPTQNVVQCPFADHLPGLRAQPGQAGASSIELKCQKCGAIIDVTLAQMPRG